MSKYMVTVAYIDTDKTSTTKVAQDVEAADVAKNIATVMANKNITLKLIQVREQPPKPAVQPGSNTIAEKAAASTADKKTNKK